MVGYVFGRLWIIHVVRNGTCPIIAFSQLREFAISFLNNQATYTKLLQDLKLVQNPISKNLRYYATQDASRHYVGVVLWSSVINISQPMVHNFRNGSSATIVPFRMISHKGNLVIFRCAFNSRNNQSGFEIFSYKVTNLWSSGIPSQIWPD